MAVTTDMNKDENECNCRQNQTDNHQRTMNLHTYTHTVNYHQQYVASEHITKSFTSHSQPLDSTDL